MFVPEDEEIMTRDNLERSLKIAKAEAYVANTRVNELRGLVDELIGRPKLLTLVGKTFKYPKNSYGHLKKESDHWPVYARGVCVEGRELKVFSFETDCRGAFIYRREIWGDGIRAGYQKCPEKEYQDAFKKQVARILP